LNSNDELDGYIVQLPLPKHIDEQKILMAIDPNKMLMDFILLILKMALEMETFLPATPSESCNY
jgi:methylenetetrahydrofolate dehydrogenase (NADP+)/methenyltetrahydrofolate cyclohydrolase